MTGLRVERKGEEKREKERDWEGEKKVRRKGKRKEGMNGNRKQGRKKWNADERVERVKKNEVKEKLSKSKEGNQE